ncbi:hypothetical protein M8R20_09420 [Pseudomonas sp. R2.Fl]|nr:hypothetical protein [Pseudomonas sp. R2.Fl]
MDARNNVKSLIENLIEPVRAANAEAKLYLVTYESPALAELRDALAPNECILLDPGGSSQCETYKEGLRHVIQQSEYDALVVARFDLDFKKKFDAWNVNVTNNSILFPWKEFRFHWRDHRRVGDAVHILGRNAIPAFHNAIIMNQLTGRTHLHMMYYYLRTMHEELGFIEDGYWDSNTLFSDPEGDNPLYKIFNRPKLDMQAPNTGHQILEIKAE